MVLSFWTFQSALSEKKWPVTKSFVNGSNSLDIVQLLFK